MLAPGLMEGHAAPSGNERTVAEPRSKQGGFTSTCRKPVSSPSQHAAGTKKIKPKQPTSTPRLTRSQTLPRSDYCLHPIGGPLEGSAEAGKTLALLFQQRRAPYHHRTGWIKEANISPQCFFSPPITKQCCQHLQDCVDILQKEVIHIPTSHTGALAFGRIIPPVLGDLAQLHPTMALHQQLLQQQSWCRWQSGGLEVANFHRREPALLHFLHAESHAALPARRTLFVQDFPHALPHFQSTCNNSTNLN